MASDPRHDRRHRSPHALASSGVPGHWTAAEPPCLCRHRRPREIAASLRAARALAGLSNLRDEDDKNVVVYLILVAAQGLPLGYFLYLFLYQAHATWIDVPLTRDLDGPGGAAFRNGTIVPGFFPCGVPVGYNTSTAFVDVRQFEGFSLIFGVAANSACCFVSYRLDQTNNLLPVVFLAVAGIPVTLFLMGYLARSAVRAAHKVCKRWASSSRDSSYDASSAPVESRPAASDVDHTRPPGSDPDNSAGASHGASHRRHRARPRPRGQKHDSDRLPARVALVFLLAMAAMFVAVPYSGAQDSPDSLREQLDRESGMVPGDSRDQLTLHAFPCAHWHADQVAELVPAGVEVSCEPHDYAQLVSVVALVLSLLFGFVLIQLDHLKLELGRGTDDEARHRDHVVRTLVSTMWSSTKDLLRIFAWDCATLVTVLSYRAPVPAQLYGGDTTAYVVVALTACAGWACIPLAHWLQPADSSAATLVEVASRLFTASFLMSLNMWVGGAVKVAEAVLGLAAMKRKPPLHAKVDGDSSTASAVDQDASIDSTAAYAALADQDDAAASPDRGDTGARQRQSFTAPLLVHTESPLSVQAPTATQARASAASASAIRSAEAARKVSL